MSPVSQTTELITLKQIHPVKPASPRPWRLARRSDHYQILDAAGKTIARNIGRKNAELIIEAVNA